jgi:hypothetical protein
MFCILLLAKLRPFCGAGPVWFSVREDDSCAKHWWINLLYINNFHKIEQNEVSLSNVLLKQKYRLQNKTSNRNVLIMQLRKFMQFFYFLLILVIGS